MNEIQTLKFNVSGFDTVNRIDSEEKLRSVHRQGTDSIYDKEYDTNGDGAIDLKHIYHVNTLRFAGRYLLDMPNGADKDMTKEEVLFLCRSGLGIVSIWQWSNSVAEFQNDGATNAELAINAAKGFGQHKETPIFFAFEYVKENVNDPEPKSLAETYFAAIYSIFSSSDKNPNGYKMGIYSYGDICRHIREKYPDIYTFCSGSIGATGNGIYGETFTDWDIKQSCDDFITNSQDSGPKMQVDWIISPETGRARECSWRHKFGDTWKSDHPNHHYVDCTECGYRHTEAHQYGNYEVCDEGKKHSRTCAVCGHLDISNHVYEEGWTPADDRKHKRTCSVCGHVQAKPHDYIVTKTEEGHRLECRICGHVIEGAHNFGTWERTDDSNHARKCKVCGYSESVGHNFETWEYNDADTHKRLCPICNWTQVKSHDYSEWQPTRDSHHTHSCSECGHTETENHNFGPWQSSGDSTHVRRCIDCGYSESAGHNFNEWVYDSATPEKHKRTCAVCKKVERQYHSYGGCTNQGSEGHTHTCSVCHHEKSESHSFDYRQKDRVVHEKYCTECSYSTVEDHIPNAMGTKCTKCGSAIERPTPIDSTEDETE